MATGDKADFAARIAAVLPRGWFPASAPVLTGILTGIGSAYASAYALIQYAVTQTRLATCTDVWLDMFSTDFFGSGLPRLYGESDTAFRARIKINLFAPKVTRPAMIAALTNLTGRAPVVFEPTNVTDTGAMTTAAAPVWGGQAYNTIGAWGSLAMPMQFLVTAYRPPANFAPVGNIGASNSQGARPVCTIGGYGSRTLTISQNVTLAGGSMALTSLAEDEPIISDDLIRATVNATRPVATIAWMRISN